MTMLKKEEVDFQKLKDLHGCDIGAKHYSVDNGASIVAEVKVTIRNGLVHTKYLHVRIAHANGRVEYYREQKNGNFKGGFVK